MEIKIDGVAYGWGDLTFNYGGHLIKDITGFETKVSQEKKMVYGSSREPQGAAYGRKTRTAKITLGYDGASQLQEMSMDNTLIGLPPQNLIVSAQKESGGKVVTYALKVEFMDDTSKWKEGDLNSSNDYDLLVHSMTRK